MHSNTPSFEMRACRGGNCPRKQTAVLWGRRCVGHECDTWAATRPLPARVDEFNVAVVHFAFAIMPRWCGSINVRCIVRPIAGLAAVVDVDSVRLCAPLISHHFTAAQTLAGHSGSLRRMPCEWGRRLILYPSRCAAMRSYFDLGVDLRKSTYTMCLGGGTLNLLHLAIRSSHKSLILNKFRPIGLSVAIQKGLQACKVQCKQPRVQKVASKILW